MKRLGALAAALVVVRVGFSVATRDRLWIVVAFAGVTLPARTVLIRARSSEDKK